MASQTTRNIWLDVIRITGIVMVMCYHFYSRHPELPTCYGTFSHGYLWVEMLFIMSGFFIFDSLTSVNSFGAFLKKKLIRLTPALWICSLLTFMSFSLFDSSMLCADNHSFANFIVSICYVSPDLVDKLLDTKLSYINGSYWFLWVEIIFYLISSAVYFLDRKHFMRNFAIVSIILFFVYYAVVRIGSNCLTTNRLNLSISRSAIADILSWCGIFHYFKFSIFFLIGILFRYLTMKKRCNFKVMMFTAALAVMLYLSKWWWSMDQMAFFIVFIILWIPVTHQPFNVQKSSRLSSFLSRLSVSSYSMYLIHEQIGILVIYSVAKYFGQLVWITPILVIIIVITLCCIGYRYVEQPIVNLLKRKLS